MAGNSIHTNPEALRSIASSIRTYTICQCNAISDYLKEMADLKGDINIQSYQLCLEAISEWRKTMEQIKSDGDSFAAWLEEKANILDELMKKH